MRNQPLIVVADDDELLRSLVEFKLRGRGYDVVPAQDGEEALKLVAIHVPDLIVLDAMMPGRDGFAVLRQLKSDAKLADIPVVMLTARRLESDIVGALQAGASDYLIKPFSPEELAARVARLLPLKDQ